MSDIRGDALDRSLGIVPPDDDMDYDDDSSTEKSEEDLQNEQLEKRKQIVEDSRNALQVYDKKDEDKSKGYEDDEEFTREMLRDLAKTGVTLLRLQQEEMLMDASARNAETAAAMISATTSALEKLNNVGINKEKLELEKEKVDIKKKASGGPGNITNNFIGVGTFSDIVKGIKEEVTDMGECIDVEAEVIEDTGEE
jgi:hypothetical protein